MATLDFSYHLKDDIIWRMITPSQEEPMIWRVEVNILDGASKVCQSTEYLEQKKKQVQILQDYKFWMY